MVVRAMAAMTAIGPVHEHLVIQSCVQAYRPTGNKKAAQAAFLHHDQRLVHGPVSLRSCSYVAVTVIDCAQPVIRIERTAHAQSHGRYIHDLVGRHFFFGFKGLFGFLLLRNDSLLRPFCLASFCRTGYRKE